MQTNRMIHSLDFYKECAEYINEGHSLKETAEKFDVKYATLRQNLTRLGLREPNRKIKNKKISFDEHYFDNIDTSNKAYFLGLLMADGYVCKTDYSYALGIALQSEDKYILERLKEELKSETKISNYKNSNKLVVKGSEHLHNVLLSYGFCEDKSHSDYTIPEQIPDEFIHDFIRGYFDGDGCISIKSSGYIVISICCNSKIFLESVKNVLEDKFNIPPLRLNCELGNRKTPIYVLYITTNENRKAFKKFIYQNNDEIKLIRKYNKFKEIPS